MLGQMAKPLRYWWYLIFSLTALAVLIVTFGTVGGPSDVALTVAATVMGWAVIGAIGALIIYVVLRLSDRGVNGAGHQVD